MQNNLEQLAKLIRHFILKSTTAAGSGHPTSSMSATELMTGLLFGGTFRADLDKPEHANNDRLIFSKGHASPLFYALYAAAGKVTESDLMKLRKFQHHLEGHPTMFFPYTEAATGSLGQGLSIGVGMALNGKYVDKIGYRTFVLLGDSEMAEGSCWEAVQCAAHYKLDNLIGIIDVNRLGQRGQTMYGTDAAAYEKPLKAFGWKTYVIDGHNLNEVVDAFAKAARTRGKPSMIIAKTLKGKGVSFMEDADGWHGKAPSEDDLKRALAELGSVDTSLRGTVELPKNSRVKRIKPQKAAPAGYQKGDKVATRKAYGDALARIFDQYTNLVVLDAEVSNSTYAEIFGKKHPERFFEMYIAEQNMVGAALGFSRRGKIPFVSTFAAFFTRAYDQIRMGQYSNANIKFCGSHAGVSIGQDGSSQMGLEDLGMFRALLGSTVFYPSDAMATDKLVEEAAKRDGIVYIRTTRGATPVIYDAAEKFTAGGSKTLKSSKDDKATVVAAGITLFEALKAHDALQSEGIAIRVIDAYSIKPLDVETLKTAAAQTGGIVTVEDHFAEGGLGEAVAAALAGTGAPIKRLAVTKMPMSGSPEELLEYEGLNAAGIIAAVKSLI